MPAVSIVTPVHSNRTDLVQQTIRSVINQTFTDFEYLIACDIPDRDIGTKRLLRMDALLDRRIRLIELPPVSLPTVANILFSAAVGRHVAFLSDDDVWNPHFLDRCLERMEANSILVWSDWWLSHQDGKLIDSGSLFPCRLARAELGLRCSINFNAAILSRRFLDELWQDNHGRYFRPDLPMTLDWELIYQLSAKPGEFVHVCEPLVIARVHPGQASKRRLRMLLEVARLRNQHGVPMPAPHLARSLLHLGASALGVHTGMVP